MDMQERIKRINTLYHKSQEEGLTQEEKEEQKILRQEYVAAIRQSLRGNLNNISIQEPGHLKWGLSYGFQMAERIPSEPWDQKMDAVLTPDEIVVCGSCERAGRI